MTGQVVEAIPIRVFNFTYLGSSSTETRVVIGKIRTEHFTEAELLVRAHTVNIDPAASGASIRVELVADASTPEDPGTPFLGTSAIQNGSVTIDGATQVGATLKAVVGPIGSMVALRVVASQDQANLALVARISADLILRDATGPSYLLDYAAATCTRASEAAFSDPRSLPAGTAQYPWGFVEATETANWKGNDVARIFSDGSVLIENERTNEMSESWFSGWTTVGGASFTADDVSSPDLNTTGESAATVTFGASATDKLQNVTGITSGAGSDATNATVSCWLRCTSGTEEARIGLRDKTGAAYLLSSDLTVTTTWTRFEYYIADIGTGGTAPSGALSNSSDAAARTIEAWGFQVEHQEKFASSDIRTSGATATRAIDDISITPAIVSPDFYSKGFSVDYWPEWAPGEHPDNQARLLGNDQDTLRLTPTSGTVQASIVIASAVYALDLAAHSRGDKITIRVEFGGTMEAWVNGSSQGTVVIGTGTWSGLNGDTWDLGKRGNTRVADGVISRPRGL